MDKKNLIKKKVLCGYCNIYFDFFEEYRVIGNNTEKASYNKTELRVPRCPYCRNLLGLESVL